MTKYLHSRVLIIDDEKAILQLLCRCLPKISVNIEIDIAESAEEAIRKIHNTTYNLILTDIKMPGMSGNELFSYVNTNVEPTIPIIAMSGTPWLLDNSDFDAVLAKPFDMKKMLNVVQQFI